MPDVMRRSGRAALASRERSGSGRVFCAQTFGASAGEFWNAAGRPRPADPRTATAASTDLAAHLAMRHD